MTHHRYFKEQRVFHLGRHRKDLVFVQKRAVCDDNWEKNRTKTRAVAVPMPQTPRLPDHRLAVCEIVNGWEDAEK